MWARFEPLHAVTYFAPEARAAFAAAGLKGFWMGYFAGRAAPMGAVTPGVVSATFYNFAPVMVRRAVPDAWGYAPPPTVLAARSTGAVAALRRLLPAELEGSDVEARAAAAAELIWWAVDGLDVAGRPLAAANLALDVPADPLLSLWQAATVLREHRGDGHLAALVEAELDGCEAHVSLVASGRVDRGVLQPARGWTDAEWEAARDRLESRGLVTPAGGQTDAGAALRRRIESETDRLARAPWERLGAEGCAHLAGLLAPLAAAVTASGVIPGTNPMGLPGR